MQACVKPKTTTVMLPRPPTRRQASHFTLQLLRSFQSHSTQRTEMCWELDEDRCYNLLDVLFFYNKTISIINLLSKCTNPENHIKHNLGI